MSFETFPKNVTYIQRNSTNNPAIKLFGNRFVKDQLPIELLIELILVLSSPKRIGDENNCDFIEPLPSIDKIINWPNKTELKYAPKARLNLKLFALMGASRIDSRHKTHRDHYKEILLKLTNKISTPETGTEQDILKTLENLFLGFQGTGVGRTWCAQSFIPICRGLLARETIWSDSAARKKNPTDWTELIEARGSSKYFSNDKHIFLARGGEVLYMQLCNALRQKPEVIKQWATESKVELEPNELEPSWLHESLQKELVNLMELSPKTLSDLAEFIDSGVESETSKATDRVGDESRFVNAGYCPEESWREGYLFAVDLLRLCKASLDLVERLQMMEIACAMQVLRSLASQSSRHCPGEFRPMFPGYRMAISSPDDRIAARKRISRHTVRMVEKLVYKAIREDGDHISQDDTDQIKNLKEADTRYGNKLFIGMAKRIGLLVPRRGAGARFTLNEQLLRMLVVTTVPIGGHLTFDSFKKLLEARHGLVFDADGFARASIWSEGSNQAHIGNNSDAWLMEMLDSAGLLVQLSDSHALVKNPAISKGAEQ